MKPQDCAKCRKLFQDDAGAQLKVQAEAMRITQEYVERYVNERYREAHVEGLHESPLDAAPKPKIIRPDTNGGKTTDG